MIMNPAPEQHADDDEYGYGRFEGGIGGEKGAELRFADDHLSGGVREDRATEVDQSRYVVEGGEDQLASPNDDRH